MTERINNFEALAAQIRKETEGKCSLSRDENHL